MTGQIYLIPKTLPKKRELLTDLEAQLKEMNRKKTKENETQRGQLGDFIKVMKKNIEQHEDQIRQHFAKQMN